MSEASELLVIILAVTLTIFLIVLSVAVVKVIQILQTVKRITTRAEELAVKAEEIGEMFKKAAGPATAGRFIAQMVTRVFNWGSNQGGGKRRRG